MVKSRRVGTICFLALLALAMPMSRAEARIVYTQTHVVLKGDGNMPIDINNDGITDFTIEQHFDACSASAVIGVTGGDGVAFGNVGPDGPWASALSAGTAIGSSLSFSAEAPELVDDYGGAGCGPFSHIYGYWQNIGPAYVGVEFTKNHKLHYGWALLEVSFQHFQRPSMTTTLSGYAYETIVGKPIIAGRT